MRKLLQFVILVALTAATCATAQAQRHVRRAAPLIISGPAGTRVVQAPLSQLAATSPENTLRNANLLVSPDATVSALLNGGYPAPGLGFDYTHYAAVNRNLGVRALIDPVTQHQLALAREIRRESPAVTPVFLPAVFNNIQIVVMQQPPVVILPQQETVQPEERAERVRYVEREEALPPPPPEPLVELSEIVLIRTDGSVVFAVAFSSVEGRLVYVTRDGIRRSFPLHELDTGATLRMNEERGTTLRLPA